MITLFRSRQYAGLHPIALDVIVRSLQHGVGRILGLCRSDVSLPLCEVQAYFLKGNCLPTYSPNSYLLLLHIVYYPINHFDCFFVSRKQRVPKSPRETFCHSTIHFRFFSKHRKIFRRGALTFSPRVYNYNVIVLNGEDEKQKQRQREALWYCDPLDTCAAEPP